MNTVPLVGYVPSNASTTSPIWIPLAHTSRGRPWEPGPIVRIKAMDLRGAQRLARSFRASRPNIPVVVDVEFLVAPHEDAARHRLRTAYRNPEQESLRYIGTTAGLASLIYDIKAADVADGVVLHPLLTAPPLVRVQVESVVTLIGTRYSASRSA